MTILDKQLQFSNGQAITVSAASENIVDLGPTGPNGYAAGAEGSDWWIHITFPVQFTADGAATMVVAVQTDNDVAFGTPITLYSTAAIGKASLGPGIVSSSLPFPGAIRVPIGAKRYLRLYYTVATGPMTAGTVTATGGASPGTNIGAVPY
jgi:hypothetical protein